MSLFLFFVPHCLSCPSFYVLAMADHGDESSHGNVVRWGDRDDRERHREHRHRQDDRRHFDMHQFIQMGSIRLVGGDVPQSSR